MENDPQVKEPLQPNSEQSVEIPNTEAQQKPEKGFFGRVKNTTLLDDRPCKRGWKGFLFRVGTAMLTLVFAALIRVQNGVMCHLTNVTYIT